MGLKMKYFVLKPKSKVANDPYAKASRKAMRVYANTIKSTNSVLADALRDWAKRESNYDLELCYFAGELPIIKMDDNRGGR